MLITFLIKHSCFFQNKYSQSRYEVRVILLFFFLFGRVDFRIAADDASKIVKPRATQSIIV